MDRKEAVIEKLEEVIDMMEDWEPEDKPVQEPDLTGEEKLEDAEKEAGEILERIKAHDKKIYAVLRKYDVRNPMRGVELGKLIEIRRKNNYAADLRKVRMEIRTIKRQMRA